MIVFKKRICVCSLTKYFVNLSFDIILPTDCVTKTASTQCDLSTELVSLFCLDPESCGAELAGGHVPLCHRPLHDQPDQSVPNKRYALIGRAQWWRHHVEPVSALLAFCCESPEGTNVWQKLFPQGRNRFREEEIISARKHHFYKEEISSWRKKSFLRRGNHFHKEQIVSASKKLFARGRNYLRKVEMFLQMIVSSQKRFIPRRNDFFLAETIFLTEMISSSWKWFIPHEN